MPKMNFLYKSNRMSLCVLSCTERLRLPSQKKLTLEKKLILLKLFFKFKSSSPHLHILVFYISEYSLRFFNLPIPLTIVLRHSQAPCKIINSLLGKYSLHPIKIKVCLCLLANFVIDSESALFQNCYV